MVPLLSSLILCALAITIVDIIDGIVSDEKSKSPIVVGEIGVLGKTWV